MWASLTALVILHAISLLIPGTVHCSDGLVLLWLGMLPLHVAGCTAAMAVLWKRLTPTDLRAVISKPLGTAAWAKMLQSSLLTVFWLYPAVALLTFIISLTMKRFGLDLVGSPIAALSKEAANPVLFWSSAVVTALIIAPLAEEFLFRLVCFNALRPGGRMAATVLTAALFAVVHRVPEQVPGLLLLGIILQRCRDEHGSLAAPILLHVCFNATALLVLLLFFLSGHHPAGL